MSDRPDAHVRLSNPGYALLSSILLLGFSTLALLTQPAHHDWLEDTARSVTVLGGPALAVRSWFVGLDIGPDVLVYTSWFRRRRYPRASVSSVQVRDYRGVLTRGTSTRHLSMLVMTVTDRTVDVPEVPGSRASLTADLQTVAPDLLRDH